MIGTLILAAASFLTSPVEEIVLLNGAVIEVEELVRVERGRLIYADADDVLYSVRLTDVDVEATDARLPANRRDPVPERAHRAEAVGSPLPGKLPVSEEEKQRILEEMESRNHTGRSSPPAIAELEPDREESVEGETDEWKWRSQARRFDRALEEAKQRLEAAKQRERELNDLLLFFAGSTGDATNYSYLAYQLSDLRSLIPRLETAVRNAEKARAQFLNDARRQGIPPGWLR
ncbi:MAG: hypothetical protein R3338_08135 [Thermoanaerobaculia bacterium]|nr:hypothetical protein [Thermoanaerobaculia bacterium]